MTNSDLEIKGEEGFEGPQLTGRRRLSFRQTSYFSANSEVGSWVDTEALPRS